MRTVQCLGYILGGFEDAVDLLIELGEYNKSKVKVKSNDYINPCLCYSKFELLKFELELDNEDNIISWKISNPKDMVNTVNFIAALKNGRILASDGRNYRFHENKYLKDDTYKSMLSYMLSKLDLTRGADIELYTIKNKIYGFKYLGFTFNKDEFEVQDVMAKHLGIYKSRYKVETITDEKTLFVYNAINAMASEQD